jgi:multidrug efflux pump subunit AcrA (membrane-fusion protein)
MLTTGTPIATNCTSQQKSTADAQVEIAKAAVAEAKALEEETRLLSPKSERVSVFLPLKLLLQLPQLLQFQPVHLL